MIFMGAYMAHKARTNVQFEGRNVFGLVVESTLLFYCLFSWRLGVEGTGLRSEIKKSLI